jgi:hypothetical protein
MIDTTKDKDTFGYQWVRKSTGEFYRGIHTGSIHDNYAGSGALFKKKYGGQTKTKCVDPTDWVRNILFIGTREECLLWESLVVTERELENPKCLNYITGGRESVVLSQDIRDKISEANSGKKLSKEHVKALKESRLGKPISDEHKAKIAESNRKRVWSEESRRKIAESRRNKGLSEEHKRNISEARKAQELKKKGTTMEGEVDVKQ